MPPAHGPAAPTGHPAASTPPRAGEGNPPPAILPAAPESPAPARKGAPEAGRPPSPEIGAPRAPQRQAPPAGPDAPAGGERPDPKLSAPRPEPSELRDLEHAGARPAGQEAPFWFFVPFPGEKAPLLFPGYRERKRGEAESSWRLFFRLPDLGAISVRFRPGAAGWSILFEVEHEALCALMAEGAPGLSDALRDRGFPLREVQVRPARRGTAESEFGAMLSRDAGLPLLKERA
jgi:hypothetical protein